MSLIKYVLNLLNLDPKNRSYFECINSQTMKTFSFYSTFNLPLLLTNKYISNIENFKCFDLIYEHFIIIKCSKFSILDI